MSLKDDDKYAAATSSDTLTLTTSSSSGSSSSNTNSSSSNELSSNSSDSSPSSALTTSSSTTNDERDISFEIEEEIDEPESSNEVVIEQVEVIDSPSLYPPPILHDGSSTTATSSASTAVTKNTLENVALALQKEREKIGSAEADEVTMERERTLTRMLTTAKLGEKHVARAAMPVVVSEMDLNSPPEVDDVVWIESQRDLGEKRPHDLDDDGPVVAVSSVPRDEDYGGDHDTGASTDSISSMSDAHVADVSVDENDDNDTTDDEEFGNMEPVSVSTFHPPDMSFLPPPPSVSSSKSTDVQRKPSFKNKAASSKRSGSILKNKDEIIHQSKRSKMQGKQKRAQSQKRQGQSKERKGQSQKRKAQSPNQKRAPRERTVKAGLICCIVIAVIISIAAPLGIVFAGRREDPAARHQQPTQTTQSETHQGPEPPDQDKLKAFKPPTREELIHKVLVHRFSSSNSMNTPDSPQYLALQWLANDDPMQVSVYDGDHLVQRYTMAVIYFSTEGRQWRNQLGFLSSLHECQWKASWTGDAFPRNGGTRGRHLQASQGDGVLSCDSRNFVTNLELSRNGLRGQIPSEVGHLTHMTRLNLQTNNLIGTIPPSLSSIPTLQQIHLQQNSLAGSAELICEQWATPTLFTHSSANKEMQVDLDLVSCSCCKCCSR